MNYTFVAHTACDYWDLGPGETYFADQVDFHFVVHFNGKTIVPSTRACVPCESNCCPNGYNKYYPVSANVTAPASGLATLEIIVTGASDPYGGLVIPFMLDLIYLYPVGYTGELYPVT